MTKVVAKENGTTVELNQHITHRSPIIDSFTTVHNAKEDDKLASN